MQRLYPTQAAGIEELRVGSWRTRKRKRTIITAPTGFGKTTVAAHLIDSSIKAGWRSLFMAHRTELIEQAWQRMFDQGITGGFVKAGKPEDMTLDLQVASVQTANQRARLQKLMEWARGRKVILLVDECHRTAGPTYLVIINALRSVAACLIIVGATATPYRLDGKGLGNPNDLDSGIYEDLIEITTPGYLFDNGICRKCWRESPAGHLCCDALIRSYLVRPSIYGIANPDMSGVKMKQGDFDKVETAKRMSQVKLVADMVTTYETKAAGELMAIFAVNRAHAKQIADQFNERSRSWPRPLYQSGEYVSYLDGETSTEERNLILAKFSVGMVKGISQCNVLIEGWDPESDYQRVLRDPRIWPTRDTPPEYIPLTVTIDGAPTSSMGRWMQGPVGRNTRSHPKKPHAKLFDHAGNIWRLKMFPEDHHGFDLGGLKIKQGSGVAEKRSIQIVTCPTCMGAVRSGTPCCPYCGATLIVRSRDIVTLDGDLELMERGEGSKRAATPAEKEAAYIKLMSEAKSGSRSPITADANYKSLFGAQVPFDMKRRVYIQFGFAKLLPAGMR